MSPGTASRVPGFRSGEDNDRSVASIEEPADECIPNVPCFPNISFGGHTEE